jgi:hypothetical protein
LVVVAMDDRMATELDRIITVPSLQPPLEDLLTAYGLFDGGQPDPLQRIKARYHRSAFDWQPFGTDTTVYDLMDDVRTRFNASEPSYAFRWEPWDLLEAVRSSTDTAMLQRTMRTTLGNGPFFVVVDPITLYHPTTLAVFPWLQEFAKAEQSVVMSLSLDRRESLGMLFDSLRSRAAMVLRQFFQPDIPASGAFWGCGVNLQHPVEIEGLVRRSVGVVHRDRIRAREKALTQGV